jgi:PncC family amidohydrolase
MTSWRDPPDLVHTVLEALKRRGLTLAVAEGDTGGLVLEWLTATPGSSSVVLGGVVAYADRLKAELVLVDPELIRQHGSVSREVADAMAVGMRLVTEADVGVAATGIAGPGGATDTKPVGLAWLAVADACGVLTRTFVWHGDRDENRASSARALLQFVLEHIENEDAHRTDVLHSPQAGTPQGERYG